MDKRLLNTWFQKGYSSKEMANFLLQAEMHSEVAQDDYRMVWDAETIEGRWAELHAEVVKHVFDI